MVQQNGLLLCAFFPPSVARRILLLRTRSQEELLVQYRTVEGSTDVVLYSIVSYVFYAVVVGQVRTT